MVNYVPQLNECLIVYALCEYCYFSDDVSILSLRPQPRMFNENIQFRLSDDIEIENNE